MANTYTQIYIHVIFAVQERAGLIKPEWREELFKYIAGILKNHGIKLIAIGGVEDHIHILFALTPKNPSIISRLSPRNARPSLVE
ncbi:MAG: transposase [Pyrinomonadaceae bacterium]